MAQKQLEAEIALFLFLLTHWKSILILAKEIECDKFARQIPELVICIDTTGLNADCAN